ncbi:MAG: general secretion pathway protein GspK, partial [Cloacibacillus sp.]|nr:general secretion pathway protein GspK [Cloacibacillus sp.]
MRRRSNGFILVSVLLSTTLLLTSATAFAWFARTEALRVSTRENILKCRNAAEIAVGVIGRKIAADDNKYDGFTEPLYAPGQRTKLEIGYYDISVQITPLNDKISVNGLLLPDGVTLRSEYETAWNAIWEELEHAELAAPVLDFIDKDKNQKLGGAERDGNINRLVSDLNEFKAMPEINDKVLWGDKEHPGGLARYLTVPGGQKININVVAPEVIDKRPAGRTPAPPQDIRPPRHCTPLTRRDER